MPRSVERPRLPPPWSIEEANNACFIVRHSTGQALRQHYRNAAADVTAPHFVLVESRRARRSVRPGCRKRKYLSLNLPSRAGMGPWQLRQVTQLSMTSDPTSVLTT